MNMSRELCRQEELQRLRERYARRNKERKAKPDCSISFASTMATKRKHAIKLLGDCLAKPTGQPRFGLEPRYELIRPVLKTIRQSSEQLCGKRLAPALALWLPHYG